LRSSESAKALARLAGWEGDGVSVMMGGRKRDREELAEGAMSQDDHITAAEKKKDPIVLPAPAPAANPAAELRRARAIAASLAPRSVERLAELMEHEDGRVSLAACESVRKWLEDSRTGGGNMADNAQTTAADPLAPWQDRHARAMGVRQGLRAAMPEATESEYWQVLAARLRNSGYRLAEAFTTDEIESAVMGEATARTCGLPTGDALPLPLRDDAFRESIDPREVARHASPAALMAGLGPKDGDTLI
jgi:hypothetical protein